MDIYSLATDKKIEEIEKEFGGKGYGEFKLAVGESVADKLRPIQKNIKICPKIKIISMA
jgi:tryptophanyl-tRNA synthetase